MSDIIVIENPKERERERREYLERQHAWVAKKDMQFYFIQNLWLCGTAIFECKYKFLFREMLRLQYFYNNFTTNHRWLVVIGSNLKLTLRLLFCPNNNNQ